MSSVAISADFLEAFAHIPKAQQRKVREFITRFQLDPTAAGINYEPIHEARDRRVRTVRIDLAYRAVVLHPERGDVFLLAWVDHHDEAMAWARDRIFAVNPVTGALQVLDVRTLEATELPRSQPTAAHALAHYGLFATFSDADLLRTGLPRPLLPAVHALRTAEELDALQRYLPAEAYEALYWIASLGYSVDQALAEVARPRPEPAPDPDDLDRALQHPDSRRRFAVVKSANELVDILNAPLAKWRVFLHPSQASLVQTDYSGPARVLGGAGTGKTVVAMHRARHLAADVFTAETDRILVTTFTKNLARNLETLLHGLCGPEFARIEVVNLHRWVAQFLRGQGIQFAVAESAEIEACWRDTFSARGVGEWSEAFIRGEWTAVVQAQGIATLDEYLRAPRSGRRVRLSRPQRALLWEILAEYRRNLAALGKAEWADMVRETRLYLAQGAAHSGARLPYRAVIVDETQDMHPEELKLIRQIVPEGPNDLFLVGDAHQRIYGRPVVLSQCGINVRGRSSKLRINYRTTEEIRDWAVGVLTGQPFDDLDGGTDTAADYVSLLHGPTPTVKHCAFFSDELSCITQTIHDLMRDVEAETICLVARTKQLLEEDYGPALARAGIPALYLQADTSEDAGPGVRLATMHRVKGLEFQHVIIAGVRDGVVPLEHPQADADEGDRAETELQERCLFHVAASRARDTLTITGYGKPSRFLA